MNMNKKHGFINLCFSMTSTLLIFIFGWPQTFLYELGYGGIFDLNSKNFVLMGIFINLVIFLAVGLLLDFWRNKKGYQYKKYSVRLPVFFVILVVCIYLVTFIDKSCL